ncbi:MAG: hypothetical protein HQ578_00155 [Chloroflexi bacterium]|nr:hypothetical protein [Chloroflexota bacterium]
MTSRVFTDEELEGMRAPTADLLTQAIDAGDTERAKSLVRQMHGEFLAMHDLYIDWTAGFMDYIYRNDGEEALYQALRQVIGAPRGKKKTGEKHAAPEANAKEAAFRRRVLAMVNALRGHLQPLKVEEDDEKVCITMQPCGSGQRLLEQGAYDPPRNLAMIQKPHPMTWGLTDFPVYCTHAPVLEILSIEALGYPNTVAIPAENVATEACTYCIYKKSEDIPEEFFQRVGKQKTAKDRVRPRVV